MKVKFSKRIEIMRLLFLFTSIVLLLFSLILEKITQQFIDAPIKIYKEFVCIIFIFLTISVLRYIKKYLEICIEKSGTFEGQINEYKNILENGNLITVNNGTGEVLYDITENIYNMLSWFSLGKIKLFIEIINCVLFALYALYIDLEIGLVIFLLILISIFLSDFFSKFVSKQMKEKQDINAEMNQFMIETLKGISTIKELNKKKYFVKKYSDYINGKYKKTIRNVISSQTFYIVQLVLSQEIIPIIVLFVGIIFSIYGKATVGISIVMMDISIKMAQSVQSIGELFPQKHVSERIKKEIEEKYFNKISKNTEESIESFKSLNVDIKSYNYNLDNLPVLNNIKFEIQKGDVFLLKGSSGSGKTTIFELIARFLPEENLNGNIYYNSVDIYNIELKKYYEHVLLVEQDAKLIEGTIKDNLMFGDTFEKDLFDEIIDTCGLNNLLSNKKDEFLITENGKNISGGEKQRIALARILLRKPQLLLLDEVTSSLDKNMRDEIIPNIIKYAKKYNITLMVISHNDDFEKYADKIYIV